MYCILYFFVSEELSPWYEDVFKNPVDRSTRRKSSTRKNFLPEVSTSKFARRIAAYKVNFNGYYVEISLNEKPFHIGLVKSVLWLLKGKL